MWEIIMGKVGVLYPSPRKERMNGRKSIQKENLPKAPFNRMNRCKKYEITVEFCPQKFIRVNWYLLKYNIIEN